MHVIFLCYVVSGPLVVYRSESGHLHGLSLPPVTGIYVSHRYILLSIRECACTYFGWRSANGDYVSTKGKPDIRKYNQARRNSVPSGWRS